METFGELQIEFVNNTYIRILTEQAIEYELREYFTFEVPGAKFQPKVRQGRWDGKIRLYNIVTKTLYYGLLKEVKQFAKDRNYKITIATDAFPARDIPDRSEIEKFIEWLPVNIPEPIRDYQVEGIVKGIQKRRAIITSPTASGKSLMQYCIARWFHKQGKKILLIVPTTHLVEQMYGDFEEYSSYDSTWNIDHCQMLYSGKSKKLDKPIMISTWQSIYKFPKEWFKQFSVILADECHQYHSKSLVTIMEKSSNIPVRLGVTGTIDEKKVHKLVLKGLFGEIHSVADSASLMKEGYISNLNIKCLKLKYPDEERKMLAKKTGGTLDYPYQKEMEYIVKHEKRNQFIVRLAAACKGNTFIFFQYVENHGKLLNDLLSKYTDRPVYFLHGKVKTEDREQLRSELKLQDNAIVIASVSLASTGMNVPSIRNIIFASPTKSKIRTLQSIGRGLRLHENKEQCKLYDIIDDFSWKKRQNFTLKHGAERILIYSKENFQFTIDEIKV